MESLLKVCLILCITSLLWACKKDDHRIEGRWQVAELLEDNAPKEMDLKDVYFIFSDDGTYAYQGNLNYREAGKYFIESKLLHTTDTLSAEPMTKAVKITLITEDSLHFLMNDSGKKQLMKLYKAQ